MKEATSNTEDIARQKIEVAFYERILKTPLEVYSEEVITGILQHDSLHYAKLFYLLSINNLTLRVHSFKSSFLYKNIENFSEDELAYICEGIKLQIEHKTHEFYYISHHFFRKIDKSRQLRALLLYLMNIGDYRTRELLLTHGLAVKIISGDTSEAEQRVFLVKFLKQLIILDNGIIKSYLVDSGVNICVELKDACVRFFLKWMERHGDEYTGVITACICENKSNSTCLHGKER
ncbi:hypothetical protein PAEPH01_2373 [Pancytospora epiphaga]|nr:hypothetical protein PAEPH01_2373 [Pancytospora epiphaga]